MRNPSNVLSAARLLIIGLALAVLSLARASASEGYFMEARVTKTRSDGTIDFWVTSVYGLPREELAPQGADLPKLPRVIATLRFKSTGAEPGWRHSEPRGSRISLRGKCEDLDRATRAPVIQVRLETGRGWRQANLEPVNRAGNTGFRKLAAGVCASEAADEPAATGSTDGAE